MARPSKYNEDTLKIANEYLAVCKEKIHEKEHFPALEILGIELDITRETMNQWTRPDSDYYKPEFSDTIKKILEIQEYKLKILGMTRNAAMPIFLLKANHGFIETSRQEITGKDGKDLPTPILQVGTDVDED